MQIRCQGGLRRQCKSEVAYEQWICDSCRFGKHEERQRLSRLAEVLPPEEQGFGPLLWDIFGDDWRRESGYEILVNAADHASMAHLSHAIGAFKGVGEARRNGVAGPVRDGVYFIRIRGQKHRVVISAK